MVRLMKFSIQPSAEQCFDGIGTVGLNVNERIGRSISPIVNNATAHTQYITMRNAKYEVDP